MSYNFPLHAKCDSNFEQTSIRG